MKYVIKCLECGSTFSEEEYVIKCPNGCNSLLRAEYTKKQITKKNLPGIWKYEWDIHMNFTTSNFSISKFFIPIKRPIADSAYKFNN